MLRVLYPLVWFFAYGFLTWHAVPLLQQILAAWGLTPGTPVFGMAEWVFVCFWVGIGTVTGWMATMKAIGFDK